MTVRVSSLHAASRSRVCQIAAAAALAWGLAGTSGALAATVDGSTVASAASAVSTPLEAGSQYAIHPGQSLNDVAIAATQSHDRATLVRASKALFDANPNAFMSHDPSRLRLGAVLTIPALDATGAAAASSTATVAGAASAPGAASAATAASGVSQTAAATVNGASGSAHAGTPASAATPAPITPASAALQASAATAAVASAPLAASAPATATGVAITAAASSSAAPGASSTAPTASQPSVRASGAHVWAGAIQPSASAAAGEGAPPAQLPAPVAAAPVVRAPAQVSSLQQLLALKNQVLLELQKHGIGGKTAQPAQAGGAASAGGQTGAAVAPASGAAVPANGATSNAPLSVGNFELSPVNLGFAAAIGAALVALLAAFGLRRRKNRVTPADVDAAVSAAGGDDTAPAYDDVASHEVAAHEVAAPEAAAHDLAAGNAASYEAAERDAETREAAGQEAAAHQAVADETAAREAEEREAAGRESAEAEAEAENQDAAAHEAVAEEPAALEPTARAPASLEIAEREAAEHEAAEHESAASFAAPEPHADALPLSHSDPEAEQSPTPESAPPFVDGWNQAADHVPEEPTAVEPDEANASRNPPVPQMDFGAPSSFGELQTDTPFGESFGDGEPSFDPAAYQPNTLREPPAPTGFPQSAAHAFSGLALGLPPRTEPSVPLTPPPSLSTQPVVEPEITAQQAIPSQPVEASHVADEINAGLAGPAAVAGMGAAHFGALNLDFDLELPPSPAQPLPSFTPQDLVRISRNKLELASEYIELGDLAGARALIHEVIDANDVATRSEARALLSTLTPLS